MKIFKMDANKKKCSKCHRLLNRDKFSPCSGGKYLRPECRSCGYRLAKERIKIRKEVGEPPDDHTCPVCFKQKDQLKGVGGRKAKTCWAVDHNHVTKKFRGYLCHNCNRALGIFKDDIDMLWRAIEYLCPNQIKKHQ